MNDDSVLEMDEQEGKSTVHVFHLVSIAQTRPRVHNNLNCISGFAGGLPGTNNGERACPEVPVR